MLDDPIITFSPAFACQCPRALKVLVTATVVGLLTGFLGVGGGFLVVPALVLALALPMEYAVGTSLVVMTVTSASALAVRAGAGATPDWGVVLALTAASVLGGLVGARVAARADTTRLATAFTVLVLGVAVYTARPGTTRPRLTASSTHRTRRTHVQSCEVQDLRQDHLVRLRPARRPGQGRRPGGQLVRRSPQGPSRGWRHVRPALRPSLSVAGLGRRRVPT